MSFTKLMKLSTVLTGNAVQRTGILVGFSADNVHGDSALLAENKHGEKTAWNAFLGMNPGQPAM